MGLDLNLSGKTAIVTGGSAGIGLATAKGLYKEGVNVVIAARSPSTLEEAIQEIKNAPSPNSQNEVISINADLTKVEDIEKVVLGTSEKFGRIDILINNAGSASCRIVFRSRG
nr:SDR family NAD(P)-dependent oxidoreductase [Cylindrospermopsis raciborskii]